MTDHTRRSWPSRVRLFVPFYCGLLLSGATLALALGADPGMLVLGGMVAGSQLAWIAVAQLHDTAGTLDGSRSAVTSIFGAFIATGLTTAIGATLLEGMVLIHSLDGPFVPVVASTGMALMPFAIVVVAMCWWAALHKQTRELKARAANLRILHILGGLALGTIALSATVFFAVRGHGYFAGVISALAGISGLLVLCWTTVPWLSALLMQPAASEDHIPGSDETGRHIAGSDSTGGHVPGSDSTGGHVPGTLSHGQTITGTGSAA